MLLEGKVALITGAGSGIGAASAELFAQHGARVAVVDWKEQGGRETVRRITNDGGQATFVHADVGISADVERAVRTAIETYGGLDVVFSNAAYHVPGTAVDLREDDWHRTLDICLKATYLLAKFAMPKLTERKGVFIITGSVHAIRGYANYTAYQAAKGGLLALTRALAADFAPAVRVNTILPGAVVTGLWDGVTEEERAEIAKMCPLKRNAMPEEVAGPALFLASHLSSYMTGAYLVVDGGLASVIQL